MVLFTFLISSVVFARVKDYKNYLEMVNDHEKIVKIFKKFIEKYYKDIKIVQESSWQRTKYGFFKDFYIDDNRCQIEKIDRMTFYQYWDRKYEITKTGHFPSEDFEDVPIISGTIW